jgi:hypothetical protein
MLLQSVADLDELIWAVMERVLDLWHTAADSRQQCCELLTSQAHTAT